MLRYYFDEHVKSAISEQLQLRGVDVLTAQAAGRADREIPDEDQLAFAAGLGRVLVTEDRDFTHLAYSHQPHAGVVVLQHEVSIGEYIEFLEVLALATEGEEMQDKPQYYDW